MSFPRPAIAGLVAFALTVVGLAASGGCAPPAGGRTVVTVYDGDRRYTYEVPTRSCGPACAFQRTRPPGSAPQYAIAPELNQ